MGLRRWPGRNPRGEVPPTGESVARNLLVLRRSRQEAHRRYAISSRSARGWGAPRSGNCPTRPGSLPGQLALLHLDGEDLISRSKRRRMVENRSSGLRLRTTHWRRVSSRPRPWSARAGRTEVAVADTKHARSLLENLVAFPAWYEAETRVVLAAACLHLDDSATARELLDQAEGFAARVPDSDHSELAVEHTRQSVLRISGTAMTSYPGRAADASVPPQPSFVSRDRRAELRVAEHGQDPSPGDLQKARCIFPR